MLIDFFSFSSPSFCDKCSHLCCIAYCLSVFSSVMSEIHVYSAFCLCREPGLDYGGRGRRSEEKE